MTVAALQRLLAEIDTQGGPDAARADRLSLPVPVTENAVVREWAAAQGIDCPRTGTPPRRVLAAWQAATTNPQKGPALMATAPELRTTGPALTVAVTEQPPVLPVGQLLKWGDEHDDPEVQDQAARARVLLTGLRRRHAADAELAAISTEAEQLEQRLAALRTREAELAPSKKTKKKPPQRDYDTRTVRAWAAENGVDCPRVGQIPKRVLEQWRASLPQSG